jgi:Mg2+/Co2+ transporter CorB
LDDIPIGTLIGVLFVLLILSGCFSLAETSMMALNRYRLKHLVLKGHRGAKLASQLLDRTDQLLGVILLGNNLINSATATLGAVIAIRFWGENELALMIVTGVITFLILVLSEITPKVIGATYADKIAPSASFILMPLLKLAYPLVWFVNLFVSALLWLLRLRPFPCPPHPP